MSDGEDPNESYIQTLVTILLDPSPRLPPTGLETASATGRFLRDELHGRFLRDKPILTLNPNPACAIHFQGETRVNGESSHTRLSLWGVWSLSGLVLYPLRPRGTRKISTLLLIFPIVIFLYCFITLYEYSVFVEATTPR